MAIDIGTAQVRGPYFVGARTGVLTGLNPGDVVFALRNVGFLAPNGSGGSQLANAPLPASQIRLRYAPTTASTATPAFEVFKATQFTAMLTGGNAALVQRRKTTGYPAITSAEVDARIADTGALAGGAFVVPALNPLDMGDPSCVWSPDDWMPQTLEQDEGIIIRVAQFSGTGILFVGVDFGR